MRKAALRPRTVLLAALAAVSHSSLSDLHEIINETIADLEIEGMESWRDAIDSAIFDNTTFRYLLSTIIAHLGIDESVVEMLSGPARDIEHGILTDYRAVRLPLTGKGIVTIAKGYHPTGHVLVFDAGLVQDTIGSDWRTLANLLDERYAAYGVRGVATIESSAAGFLTTDDLAELGSFVDTVGYGNRLKRFEVSEDKTPGESFWGELSLNATEGESRAHWYEHIATCSYPVLFKKDIELICEALPEGDILSIGCGSGYVEWCFEKYGGRRVIATDPRIDDRFGWSADWRDIVNLDAVSAVERFQETNILMVSWTYPEDGDWDFEALTRFTGDWLIYLGEPRGGYTSTDQFFDELDYGWESQLVLPTARVAFLTDTAQVFRRKPDNRMVAL